MLLDKKKIGNFQESISTIPQCQFCGRLNSQVVKNALNLVQFAVKMFFKEISKRFGTVSLVFFNNSDLKTIESLDNASMCFNKNMF